MKQAVLFILVCALAGLVAALGSIVGAVVSHKSLFVGAIAGGLIGAYSAVWVAKFRRLITEPEVKSTAIGGCIGFLAAAAITVNNLHTPIIPILSTGLAGVGSLSGLALYRGRKKV